MTTEIRAGIMIFNMFCMSVEKIAICDIAPGNTSFKAEKRIKNRK